MKKKVKHIEDCRKAFEIEVPPADFKKRLDASYERVGRRAAVPGFRAGKAPRDMLERHYGEKVTKEAIEDLISETYHKALEESDFVPLGLPEVSDVKLDAASALSFKVEFNIRPKLQLKEYKGLKLVKRHTEVKPQDIDKSVEALREAAAKFKNAEDRAVAIGDYIVCDSEVFIDGKSIAKKRENIWMPIEEKSYIPGLSGGLAGSRPGDERQIEVVLPQDFQNKDYAGRQAVFKIKIKEIKEKSLPGIDDAFAKDAGYSSLEELRASVKNILENQLAQQTRNDLEHQVIEKLLAAADFNIPGSLVERQLSYLVEEEKNRLLRQGIKEADIKDRQGQLQEKLRPVASKQVRTMFILDEVANREGVTVSDEEMDGAFDELARRYSKPKEAVEKYYRENDLISGLRADIKNSKILEFLIKEANIEQVAEDRGGLK